MAQILRYAAASEIRVDVPPKALVADCTRAPGPVLEDLSAAVTASLIDPLGFPPLTRAVVPGDRVAISLERGIPQPSEIVSGVIHTLLDANIDAADIVVLRCQGDEPNGDNLSQCLAVDVTVHDPHERAEMSYLAASARGTPIYLNRHLCDADFVIPIGLLRPASSLGYVGVHGGLYPTFSDEATQQRFHSPKAAKQGPERNRRRAEADEVAWLLGVQLSVQVVPGPGNSALHVLAGLAEELDQYGHELVEAAWTFRVPREASLVIAAIEGDRDHQNWENFGRALYAASRICADQGTIILCTDIECPPGQALKRLAGHGKDSELLQRIQRVESEDAMSASLLLEVRDRHHIYLLSGLDEEVVEAIGLGCITDPVQIGRLIQKHDSCILLANAHQAVAHVIQ